MPKRTSEPNLRKYPKRMRFELNSFFQAMKRQEQLNVQEYAKAFDAAATFCSKQHTLQTLQTLRNRQLFLTKPKDNHVEDVRNFHVTGLSVSFEFTNSKNVEAFGRLLDDCFLGDGLRNVFVNGVHYDFHSRALDVSGCTSLYKYTYIEQMTPKTKYRGFTVKLTLRQHDCRYKLIKHLCSTDTKSVEWFKSLSTHHNEQVECTNGSHAVTGQLVCKWVQNTEDLKQRRSLCIPKILITAANGTDELISFETFWQLVHPNRQVPADVCSHIHFVNTKASINSTVALTLRNYHLRHHMQIFGMTNVNEGQQLLRTLCTTLEHNWNLNQNDYDLQFPAWKLNENTNQTSMFTIADELLANTGQTVDKIPMSFELLHSKITNHTLDDAELFSIYCNDADLLSRHFVIELFNAQNEVLYKMSFHAVRHGTVKVWICNRSSDLHTMKQLKQLVVEAFTMHMNENCS